MSWPPSKNVQVFDERSLKENLIADLRLNQTDALAWANTGSRVPLEDIRLFNRSPRLTTIFPALTILQTEHSTAWGNGEMMITVLSMTFELAIQHGNQDTLTDQAVKYAMALESMLANVPETTFGQDSIIPITTTVRDLETVFDLQGKLKTKFIQISQTKISWVIEAAMYNV